MGYFHIRLTEDTSNVCPIILLWGEYCYKLLQMRVSNSPEIFQQKVNELFQVFEFICVYIEKNLILVKGYWKDHVQKLERTLNKLN